MPYNFEGVDTRAEVQKGALDSLVYFARRDGEPGAPTNSFVTVYDPSGTVISARSAAVAGGARLSFSRTWNEELGEDYSALWEWTDAGLPYAETQSFDVVRSKLPVLVGPTDLLEVYPDLEEHLAAVGQPDATRFIRRAWSIMLDRIRGAGKRPSLILDRSRLVNPGLSLSLAYACNALAREQGDLWDTRGTRHERAFESMFSGLGTLRYDVDEDGLVGENDKKRVAAPRAFV